MQRRAAAIYVVFFVVVAIVAFSLTTVAEEPTISIEGESYTQGQTLRAGGTAWTVNVSDGTGQLSTVNQSARFTAGLANNSSVVFRDGSYRPAPNGSGGGGATGTGSPSPSMATTPGAVGTSAPTAGGDSASVTRFRVVIENVSAGNASGNASGGSASNISSFTLREQVDAGALLRSDPAVANTTLTAANGTQFVRYRNGSTQPLEAYLPAPETRNVSVGGSFPYQNNSTTVARINSSAATLEWEGRLTRTKPLEEGQNVSVGGTDYVAHFPQNSTVVLSQNVTGYQAEMAEVDDFNQRILGLWGVVIISLFAAILIAALAYLPVRG